MSHMMHLIHLVRIGHPMLDSHRLANYFFFKKKKYCAYQKKNGFHFHNYFIFYPLNSIFHCHRMVKNHQQNQNKARYLMESSLL